MAIDRGEQLQILLTEMALLQGRFDKYDDLIFRNREWSIAIETALLGGAVATGRAGLALLGAVLPVSFLLMELIIRGAHWYSYVVRYRHVRDTLNDTQDFASISLYDLTNKYHRRPGLTERIIEAVSRWEHFFFFGMLSGAAVIVYSVL